MVLIKINSGKGFKYIDEIIYESTHQQISAQVRHIPDQKTGKRHHVDFVITKKTKNPTQSWEDAETTKTIFSSDDSQSLQKLLAFIKAQPDLSKYQSARLTLQEAGKVGDFTSVSKEDREFIGKVLTTFNTPEKKELLVKAKQEDVNNLYAAVKQAKNKKALLELRELMKDKVDELALQAWIAKNTWVFGVEYLRFLDSSKIGIHSDSDFIVESLDGYADLIELKKCDFKLFNYDSSHDSYYPSADLSQVLGQAIKYLKTMEDSRLILKDEDGLDVLKPRIKVVIGRSSTMNVKEKEALRLLNDALHNIEIITYDEIYKRAEKLIASFENQEQPN